jgi:hypothetical protein
MNMQPLASPIARAGLGFLAVVIASVACAADGPALGYRGDGSCVAPDAKPPLRFDVASGQNVLWKSPLPNWGLGCPVVVRDRVVVMSEPDRDHDFPVLLCFDAATGRLLWQRELDAIALMGPADARLTEARKAWHDHLVALRLLYRMRHVARTAPRDEAGRVLEQNGCEFAESGAVGWKGDGSKRGGRIDVNLARTFNRVGLYFDVWHLGGLGRIGYGYPTPVTDGQFVYVATGQHVFACFDLEGKVRWQSFVRGQDTSNAGYGGNDFCKNARSPLLHGDLFISDVGNVVRAFDKRTGQLLWSDKIFAGHAEIVSPVVIRSAGRDVLMTFGINAYLLPEGRKLKVEGWANHGGTMLVKSDERDVVFFTGGGEHGGWENKGNSDHPPPAAVKFSLEGDALKAKVLWAGIEGKSSGERHTGIVYHGGKLYHPGGCILDAATGRMLAGAHRGRVRATPQTRHLTWIAGGHVYGLIDTHKGKDGPAIGLCEVYALDGNKVAENAIPLPQHDAAKTERIIETVGGPQWGFSYGCPFLISGGRIYIRSNDLLYCIGEK